MLIEARELIKNNSIISLIPYRDEIYRRNLSLICAASFFVGGVIYLMQIFLPASQTSLFNHKVAATIALLVCKAFLDGDDVYKAKKQLYMDLQKVYRLKRHEEELRKASLPPQESLETPSFEKYQDKINKNYTFCSINEKIELLKKCIEEKKLSRYVK
jgi:tRNA(Glu) U13 pseudouridine synthase TruD